MKLLYVLLLILVCLVVSSEALEMSHDQTKKHPWSMSRDLMLEFVYAARTDVPFASNEFSVKWNDKVVLQIKPHDKKVNFVQVALTAKEGSNFLHFSAQGKSDQRGVTIDEIYLYRPSSQPGQLQYLVDEDFQKYYSGKDFKFYNGKMGVWKNSMIEVGNGRYYNTNWKKGNIVMELDVTKNEDIKTEIKLDKHMRHIQ